MNDRFLKPRLNGDRKNRLKALYRRDAWGGIFSSRGRERISFIEYVLNDREFRRYSFTRGLAAATEC
jgi:hypothetical protein